MKVVPEWATSTETLVGTWNHPEAEAWVEEHRNQDTDETLFVAIDTSGSDGGVIAVSEYFAEASNKLGEMYGFNEHRIRLED